MQQELATLQQLTTLAVEFLVKYSFQIIGAIIILLVGIKLAGWLGRVVTRFCEKHKVDITLSRFMGKCCQDFNNYLRHHHRHWKIRNFNCPVHCSAGRTGFRQQFRYPGATI